MESLLQQTIIPTRLVGPIKILSPKFNAEIKVPLATLETPLWHSVNRGARISRLTDGIRVQILQDCMTRSVLVEAPDAAYAGKVQNSLLKKRRKLENIVAKTSRFTKLQDWHLQIVGNLLYLRFSFTTADAAGHNMATKAAEALLNFILKEYPALQYVSISANFCVDKKNSAVNGILGRGKYAVAEILIPEKICHTKLHTTPEQITALNIKKNLIGSILSGSVRSANAHFANMLLAFYLATGQDAANIVEGSQGIVHTEVRANDLYFSVTLPNIIVGAQGSGKTLPFAEQNLKMLGCLEKRAKGENAKRLAIIAAATVLCGELSLLAALTCQGELMRGHLSLERRTENAKFNCSQNGSS